MDQIAYVGVNVSRDLKLFGHEIIFGVDPTCVKIISHVTDGQTGGQRDRQTIYCGITALCVASRGKNFLTRAAINPLNSFISATFVNISTG